MIDLSQNIDSTKTFIINRSILNGRYDPEMVLYSKKTNTFIFEAVPLKKLLKKNPQYGANESGIERTNFEEPRYIRITDIDEFGLLNDSIGVTAQRVEEKYILNNNDILFARSGATVGKAYLHKSENVNYRCFFAGYMIRFVVDESKILPEYLFTYTQLNLYKDWVKAIQRAAGQPNINAEEYKSLLVALPPIKIQKEIVDKINNAYKLKQQKEAEAKKLLESIDKYLLNELGIVLPQKDYSIEKRVFTTQFSELTGGRFDAISNKSKELEESLLNGTFETIRMSKIVKKIKTGTTPHNSLNPYSESGIPFLRNSNLQKGELDLSDVKYINKELSNLLTFSSKGEIIVCIAGTVGESALNTSEIPLAINQNVSSITINDDLIDPIFLVNYLNTELNIQLVKRLCSIATILYLNNPNLLSLNIPIPPMEKQKEIANHILEIRTKANQLQEEAKAVLESAKQDVEKIILG